MAAKPPDAFLSYTRFDDRHDGGAITDFCRRLASAVQAVTGLPFRIFQDIEGIGIGEHWPGKLGQMLNETRFFIPILTPSYFMSKPCREELEKFLRAEAERGRTDLVVPIYYIECDVLEDEDLRAADHLASTLHERQRQDWPLGGSTTCMAMSGNGWKIAGTIRTLARRTMALPGSQPMIPAECSAAAPGTSILWSFALPTASGISPLSGTTSLASE